MLKRLTQAVLVLCALLPAPAHARANLCKLVVAGRQTTALVEVGRAVEDAAKIARATKTTEIIGATSVTDEILRAVEQAHQVGYGQVGKDLISPAGLGNYTTAQLLSKTRILRAAGLPRDKVRELVEQGVVGIPPPELGSRDLAHWSIAHDLYAGRVVQAERFSANGNQGGGGVLYKVKIFNPETGRTRSAFFKPRVYGDGEGWHRVPMEFVAYRLNRMLGMDYVPPVAYRRWIDADYQQWGEGALIYAIPDAHSLGAVDVGQWSIQRELVMSDARILDVLLLNSDRGWGNFLRGKHWATGEYRPAFIDNAAGLRPGADVRLDHQNAFGTGAVEIVRERTLQNLRNLNASWLNEEFGEFVSQAEIWQILGRRDSIVGRFDQLIAERGYDNVVWKVDDFR